MKHEVLASTGSPPSTSSGQASNSSGRTVSDATLIPLLASRQTISHILHVTREKNLTDDSYCFVCGRENPLGLKVRVHFEDGVASFTATLPREMQGWEGIIHGGFVAMLLDEAMAHAVGRSIGPAVTARMEMAFKSPLAVDEEATVTGRLVSRRSRAGVAEAEIRGADNRLVATARSEFIFMGPRKPLPGDD